MQLRGAFPKVVVSYPLGALDRAAQRSLLARRVSALHWATHLLPRRRRALEPDWIERKVVQRNSQIPINRLLSLCS
jgi:hypothetical protein